VLQRTDENQQVAAQLREVAALLQAQGAIPFRVGAYRKAADTVARLERPVRTIFDVGGRSWRRCRTWMPASQVRSRRRW